MSTANTMPNAAPQHLLDQRLDAIDRALLGVLPRSDRLTMVAQVESRIRELAAVSPAADVSLSGSPQFMTSADQESCGSTAWPSSLMTPPQAFVPAPLGMRPATGKTRSRLAIAAAVLGILALGLLFVTPVTYFVVELLGEFLGEVVAIALLGAHLAAVTVGGVLAVTLAIAALVSLKRRRESLMGQGWAITGLCTGPLPMLAGGATALFFGFQLLASQTMFVQTVTTGDPVPTECPLSTDALDGMTLPSALPQMTGNLPPMDPGTPGQPVPDAALRQPQVQPAGHQLPEDENTRPQTGAGERVPPSPDGPASSPSSVLPRAEPAPPSGAPDVPQSQPAPDSVSPPTPVAGTPPNDIGG